MENPSKFMALSSSKGNNIADRYDRLVELPDHIIHHIISFLGANDIARLGFASKRYQQICISSPYLYFDVEFASNECNTKCRQFREFLNKLLDGQRIHRFHLHWLCKSCECSDERPHHSWVRNALRCKLQELDIKCRLNEEKKQLALPLSAANYQSLRILTLNSEDLSSSINDLWSVTLVSLEVLSLKRLTVNGSLLGAWISTNCKSLKKLNLKAISILDSFCITTTSSLEELTINDCITRCISVSVFSLSINGSSLKNIALSNFECEQHNAIAIACSSLENSTIKGCYFGRHGYISITCPSLENLAILECVMLLTFRVTIKCPSMKNLEISRCTFENPLNLHINSASLRHLSISGFSTLFRVTVSAEQLQTLSMKLDSTSWWRKSIFKVLPQDLMSLQDVTIKFLRFDSFSNADICNRILRIVRYAKVLQMSLEIFEVLSKKDHLPILFDNLHDSVVLCGHLKACQMITIASFLIRAPNLRTVTIRYNHNPSRISETDVRNMLVELLPLAVENYQLQHGNSETLLFGDQLMKLKIKLLKNE